MASHRTNAMSGVLVRALRPAPDGGTDGSLLGAFIDRRDPAAFAELVRRHGPMVLGVCSRVLRHAQDAEDAFQATFLVLARKAGSVSPRNGVGNWLYGVAHQTAVRTRAITMKRRGRESLVPVPDPAVPEPGWDDLAAVLDEELGRLPDHYRAVIVLCDVEGRTRPDAAAHLGCPEGSVSSRLSRARAMLARRLMRRGVTLSAGALVLLVSQNATSAGVPAALLKSTVEAAGGGTLAGGVSPAVATLTDGVLKAMLMTKLKSAALAALAVAVVGLGGIAGFGQSGGQDRPGTKAGPEVEKFLVPVPKDVKKPGDDKLIQGTWVLTDLQQVNHEPSKEEREAWKKGEFKITFTAETMIFNVDKSGVNYRLDPTRKPRVVEWLDGGKVIARGIYDLAGDDLKVCMGRKPDMGEAEAPTDFDIQKAKPGTFPTLFVLKRDKTPPPDKTTDGGLAWGGADKGLRLGLLATGPGRLTVALENVGKDALTVNLGLVLANGKKQLPTALGLSLTDAAGRTHRLTFKTPGVAGRVDPFLVPLPPGGRYTLPLALDDFAGAGPGGPPAAGRCKLAAEFVGAGVTDTNSDMRGLALTAYWTGTVRSGETGFTVSAETK